MLKKFASICARKSQSEDAMDDLTGWEAKGTLSKKFCDKGYLEDQPS